MRTRKKNTLKGDKNMDRNKIIVFVVFAVIVLIVGVALSVAIKPDTSESNGTAFMVYPGVEMTVEEVEELVGDAFSGYPEVAVVASIGQEAYIIDIPGEGVVITVPTAEGFKGTDFENAVLKKDGVKGAQASQIALMLARRASGQPATIDFSTSIREQYMLVVDDVLAGMPEGDLLNALNMTYLQMDLDKSVVLNEQLAASLEHANDNAYNTNIAILEDRQHERETTAEVSKHSQDSLVTMGLGVLAIEKAPIIIFWIVILAVIAFLFFAGRGGELIEE